LWHFICPHLFLYPVIFSKRIPSIKRLIQGLVIPYFVYELVYYFLYTLVLDKHTGLYFDRPKFSLWYLMALFVWRLLAPVIRKVPYHMPLLFAGGLLIGFVGLGNYLSIPRILFFFPVFLWRGWNFDSSVLERFRKPAGYCGALAVLTMLIIGLFVDDYHHKLPVKSFLWQIFLCRTRAGSVGGDADPLRMLCAVFCIDLSAHVGASGREKSVFLYRRTNDGSIYLSWTGVQLSEIRNSCAGFGEK